MFRKKQNTNTILSSKTLYDFNEIEGSIFDPIINGVGIISDIDKNNFITYIDNGHQIMPVIRQCQANWLPKINDEILFVGNSNGVYVYGFLQNRSHPNIGFEKTAENKISLKYGKTSVSLCADGNVEIKNSSAIINISEKGEILLTTEKNIKLIASERIDLN